GRPVQPRGRRALGDDVDALGILLGTEDDLSALDGGTGSRRRGLGARPSPTRRSDHAGHRHRGNGVPIPSYPHTISSLLAAADAARESLTILALFAQRSVTRLYVIPHPRRLGPIGPGKQAR